MHKPVVTEQVLEVVGAALAHCLSPGLRLDGQTAPTRQTPRT
jgi:hypothetical protein